MIEDHCRLIPLLTDEMKDAVHKAAKENNDGVLDPTHAVIKNGQIIGAISVQVQCASWWMDSEKSGKRDTLSVLQCLDTLMLDRQIFTYLMPCKETSPYYKIMDRGGFEKLSGNWGLFLKKLKE